MRVLKADPGGDASRGEDDDNETHVLRLEDRVLRDLGHDLNGFCHKLFFWAEHVETPEPLKDNEPLDETVGRLHELIRLMLEYLRAPELSCTAVKGADLVESLAATLRAECGDAVLDMEVAPNVGDASVSVDPQRFVQATMLIGRGLRAGAPDGKVSRSIRCRIACADEGKRELQIRIESDAELTQAPVLPKGFEWAVARRTVELHGGSLTAHGENRVMTSCVMTLPRAA